MKLAAIILSAGAVLAQDLPPSVLLLSRIKRHVRQEVEHLPDYACLQTAQRFKKSAGAKGGTQPEDTMRVEVLFAGNKELYSPPGGSSFRDDHMLGSAGYGLSGTGAFGSFVNTLFVNDSGMFTWRGEEELEGRRTVRYDYRVPVMLSGWEIGVEQGHGIAGMKGAIWADPETLDLLRLQVNGDDIPLELGVQSVSVTVDYGRTRIGSRDVMLPQTGEMRLAHTSGEESWNRLEFTHCRAFQTESTVRFGAPDAAAIFTPTKPPAMPPQLPAGLTVVVKLAGPISDRATVGEMVEGTISGNVTGKGRIWIPDGAHVTGRIRRMYRHPENGGYFTVGIEFTDVIAGDGVFRFFADLTETDRLPEISVRKETGMADLPGVGTFFVNGTRFTLPAGFRMVWKTRSPARP